MSDDSSLPAQGKVGHQQTTRPSGESSAGGPALSAAPEAAVECPARIGRYLVEDVLGKGGFGIVYLACDELLQRQVAVKVPYAERLANSEDAAHYLQEARLAASLAHPHIVPVYDVGSTDQFPCYIVSKYVDGRTLAQTIAHVRLNIAQATGLVATLAEALHHAHKLGIVHRDVKPGNVLLDSAGQPFLLDFGVALRERDAHDARRYAGTPAYMSPEQARGEGHRVDGRSDIFSLGVVLYELLAGRRPFSGADRSEVLQQVTSVEAKPLRQLDDKIPKELERICLKALAKRAGERYTTAKDLADELRSFLGEAPQDAANSFQMQGGARRQGDDLSTNTAAPTNERHSSTTLRIVPKGLRSFDEYDADFFLDLLPGPRDRNGLPDSIRFWKIRIEEPDPEKTFSVGLIYGPSGCGKSSQVKAGLLPRIARNVVAVYLEATADATEARLLNGLRRQIADLPRELNLKESLEMLRRGGCLAADQKLLIVIDQFEQWLHANKEAEAPELVSALRQCDGARLQCLLVARDDFWLAVSRFFHMLEVELVEGKNFALSDLFDLDHARKVLVALGQAFGRLPEKSADATSAQKEFVAQAISGLSEGGKVISVRLALFAQMMSGKSWTRESLKASGGTQGVGLQFLEDSFNNHANPTHRLHQKAARAVLKSLLPEFGSDIRGHMRSCGELLEASGYANRPQDFDQLVSMLDGELRLITPCDPEEAIADGESPAAPAAERKYYQLTHDFLVPQVRNWTTQKDLETRRGRAQRRLDERVQMWQIREETRQLPSVVECAAILLFTSARRWSDQQRLMMKRAMLHRGLRWGGSLLTVVAVGAIVLGMISAQRSSAAQREAQLLVAALLAAPADAMPYALQNLQDSPAYAVPLLSRQLGDESADAQRRLRAATALAEFGHLDLPFLAAAIAQAPADECANIVHALKHDAESALGLIRGQMSAAEAAQDWELASRLAVAALYLGDAAPARDMLQAAPDPVRRTVLIDVIPDWHGDLNPLFDAARTADDPAFLSGICLAVGSIPKESIPAADFGGLQQTLAEAYATNGSGAVHSASGWALRQWNAVLPALTPERLPGADRKWLVNSLGMTMLAVPPGSFVREIAVATAPEKQLVEISKAFLIADREVTRRQFESFINDPDCPVANKPKDWQGAGEERSPTLDHPVQSVSWQDAALFCNWLSRKEGLAVCYSPDGELVPEVGGYRLPFEAEWEYACRAGTETDFAWGSDLTRLLRYAVCQSNTTEPCGSRLPNAWGLFDCHGNVYEWCQDCFAPLPGGNRLVDPTGPKDGSRRVLRGGAFDYLPAFARSIARESNVNAYRSHTIGFRPVRSLP